MNIAQEILARTENLLKEMKKPVVQKQKEQRKKVRGEIYSGKGYVYTYDTDGKPIPKSRVLMEEKLGRPLHEYEVVVYVDGDRRNCVIENLALGFRQNSPVSKLICLHCGTVGEITLQLDAE